MAAMANRMTLAAVAKSLTLVLMGDGSNRLV